MIAVSPAGAADKPAEPIYKAAPASLVMPYWTGIYLGAHIGGMFGSKIFTDSDGIIEANSSLRGWFGGLQTGYNYRLGWLVLGVEGESTWSRARGVFPCFSLLRRPGMDRVSGRTDRRGARPGAVLSQGRRGVGSRLVFQHGDLLWNSAARRRPMW